MSDNKPLDGFADVLPVGLQPTPFGEVWQALQQVAAGVWNVNPSVYRAGMAWLWYAVNHPDKLASDSLRALLVAALISEQAPMVKDWQTNAELVEYLRIWRTYSPTYAKLEAIFSTFGARVEVRPISDAESQGIVPVSDRRLAFYLRVEDFDAARPLTLDEVYQIAVRATPLGARPVPYFALVGASDVFAGPASAGLVRALWSSEPAEPVTPPTPAYTEITLYMVNGNKRAQNDVTSAFTGNVNSTYCYQLYTDAECTTPWNAYDYSNNYELVYNGVVIGLQKVSDLPSTTVTSGASLAYILMDTGSLWLASNMTGSGYQQIVFTTIALRIYPKAQQHYAFYKGSTSNSYENGSLSNGNISGLKGKPYISGVTQQTVPWGVQDNTLPVRTLQKVLGSAGNELSLTGLDWRDPSLGYNFYQLANNSGSSVSFRTVLFTLSMPTLNAYTTTANSNVSVAASGVSLYFGDGSGKIPYDSNYSYRVIGLFKANGDAANGTWAVVNDFVIYDDGSGNMAIKRNTNSGVALKRVWCTKTLKPIETTFGASVTIPAGFEVESVQCEAIFVKADTVSLDGTTVVNFEFNGERAYCNDTNTSLFGVRVDPCLQLFVLTSDTSYTGYYLSCRSSFTGSNRASTASASVLNGGGKFLVGTATASASDMAYIDAALRIRPVWISRTDSSGNRIPYYYKIQQSVWNFSGGVFSWLGDITDATDPAHWYNGVAVRINLRPITT